MLTTPVQHFLPMPVADDLTVSDFFAGAGGESTGIAQVPGVRILSASNHCEYAINIHNANHPEVDHACVDLHQERPSFFPSTDVGWFSPECTKWSQSNSTPLPDIEEGLFVDPNENGAATQSRLLMFDVLRYVEHHRYRVFVVENVVDIATQPKYRPAWQEWQRRATALGYNIIVVSFNAMHAQTYGPPAPQSRDRIFILCYRIDHPRPEIEKILSPRAYCPKCGIVVESTQAWKKGKKVGRYRQSYIYIHGSCGTQVEPSWLPASDAIDWSIPGERIGDKPLKEFFDKKTKQSLGHHPLAPKTLDRIVAGIARYWGTLHIEAAGNTYDAADPAHPKHGDPDAYYRAWPVSTPLKTLHTHQSKALVVPVEGRDGKHAKSADGPLRTMTTRLETALVGPGQEQTGRARRAAVPFIAELRGGSSDARSVTEPAATFTAGGNHHALVTPGGTWIDEELPGTSASKMVQAETRTSEALVTPYYGNSDSALPIDMPIGTLTTRDRYALITRHNNNRGGLEAQANLTTPVTEYMRTLTTTGQQSLLQHPGRPKVNAADIKAAKELVYECMFRMFLPHEVAAGMAFPSNYIWQPEPLKKISNRNLVRAAGNAVCPPCARDIMAVIVESFHRSNLQLAA
ncbi:DNA cytosine methyltransferase [Nocardioides sp. NPDC057764]|uniref:DNA cytosine methyltransferase n=1 Tax=Nocardioides sp. NPDC057764 TaxID=3346243 RepID=UPI00366DE488